MYSVIICVCLCRSRIKLAHQTHYVGDLRYFSVWNCTYSLLLICTNFCFLIHQSCQCSADWHLSTEVTGRTVWWVNHVMMLRSAVMYDFVHGHDQQHPYETLALLYYTHVTLTTRIFHQYHKSRNFCCHRWQLQKLILRKRMCTINVNVVQQGFLKLTKSYSHFPKILLTSTDLKSRF